MKKLNNNISVFLDVDDTLLMYNNVKYWEPGENTIEILHPLSGEFYYLVPHIEHIRLLKSYKAQGYTVIVWSAQGEEWAETAVKSLKLEAYVDWVASKPIKYVDDLKGSEILGSRVYIPYEQINKQIEPGEEE